MSPPDSVDRPITQYKDQRSGERELLSGSQPDTSSEEGDYAKEEYEDDDDHDDESNSVESNDEGIFRPEQPFVLRTRTDDWLGIVLDKLARLINGNLLQAAFVNAQHLGIDVQSMKSGALMYTPRSTSRSLPAALTPVQLQSRVAHDPIIDAIPHARFRHNLLSAIANQQATPAVLSCSTRGSGAME
ncbi:hypothetical protein LTR62_006071 [Meristemomyces frigidus]|uniref:Uncharacterized protein n=1 Tax=Meristemomyces frigidus TaxID=1508187 RepID=A0AAN7TNX0_9PEZI|nr:hypothetical protein LTR62_006071 [Meristemomyces frigidus]